MAIIDRVGMKFGRLTVLSFEGFREYKSGLRSSLWKVRCECGKEKTITAKRLTHKEAGSCGCYQRKAVSIANTKHGKSRHRLYKVWTAIKERCYNKNTPEYKNYGARGIAMHQPWVDSFQLFYDYIGEMPNKNMSIDRIDNSKGYEPNNIKWATQHDQMRNTRKNILMLDGDSLLCLKDWCSLKGVNYSSARQALKARRTHVMGVQLTPANHQH